MMFLAFVYLFFNILIFLMSAEHWDDIFIDKQVSSK